MEEQFFFLPQIIYAIYNLHVGNNLIKQFNVDIGFKFHFTAEVGKLDCKFDCSLEIINTFCLSLALQYGGLVWFRIILYKFYSY